MGFVILMTVSIWFIIWPVLLYYYFKGNTHALPSRTRLIAAKDALVGPALVEDNFFLSIKIDDAQYLMEGREVSRLIDELRSVNLSVQTMNEVQSLDIRR